MHGDVCFTLHRFNVFETVTYVNESFLLNDETKPVQSALVEFSLGLILMSEKIKS